MDGPNANGPNAIKQRNKRENDDNNHGKWKAKREKGKWH
jgi:hypothetical protein